MAQVYGQIEPLKQIRERLNLKGIDRFNSIREIDAFLKNYQTEKDSVYIHFQVEFENKINEIEAAIKDNQRASENCERAKNIKLDDKISRNHANLSKYRSKRPKFFLFRFFVFLLCKFFEWRIHYLEKNYSSIIHRSSKKYRKIIADDSRRVSKLLLHREEIIASRTKKVIDKLEFTKEVVDELSHLIAGAVGENKVVNEIKKLPDDNILINDFSLNFSPPIYNKKEKDRIHSIQIDHLLITKAGVFILETKNWSKNSINSYSLWSPIEQIRRTSYALFVLLKKRKIRLKWHHWGEKQIPIRSIVVMINKKPKEEFQFVKVKTLRELNGYIKYFEPIFSDSELSKISNYFINLSHKNQ